jgi:hypothetical protein
MNKQRITKKVSNMKVKAKHPRERLRSRLEQRIRKYSTNGRIIIWEETDEEV